MSIAAFIGNRDSDVLKASELLGCKNCLRNGVVWRILISELFAQVGTDGYSTAS